jgi:hypothetical protein
MLPSKYGLRELGRLGRSRGSGGGVPRQKGQRDEHGRRVGADCDPPGVEEPGDGTGRYGAAQDCDQDWQAGSLAAALNRPASSPAREPGNPAGWLRFRRRRGTGLDDCPVCLASAAAAQRAVDDLRGRLRAAPGVAGQVPLCIRHLLYLKAADPWAAQVIAPGAVDRAGRLAAELDAAFSKGTWAHRHEARGEEMTAWRRAAAFLDGGVFCGSPPRGT